MFLKDIAWVVSIENERDNHKLELIQQVHHTHLFG